MKNLKLLLLLLIVGISACKKKDAAIDPKVAIVGKWHLKSAVQTSYKNNIKQEEISPFEHFNAEFKANGEVQFSEKNCTYEIEGNNRLKLIVNGQTTPDNDFEIIKITNYELTLNLEVSHMLTNADVFKTTLLLNLIK